MVVQEGGDAEPPKEQNLAPSFPIFTEFAAS